MDGKVFDKWDKSFSSVRSDLTVTALYRDKGTFTVTFKDYSGLVLGTVKVNEGDTAKAPVTPSRDGYTFSGADATFTVNVSEMFDQNMNAVKYAVVGKKITLK